MYRGFIHRNLVDGGASPGEDCTLRIQKTLERTRFYGLGSPAESGWHLLYSFRHVNSISNNLFPGRGIPTEPIDSLCLVDDASITADQARLYYSEVMKVKCKSKFFLLMLTTEKARSRLERAGFIVIAPIVLKDSEIRLRENSPIISDLIEINSFFSQEDIEQFLRVYGTLAWNDFPVGYGEYKIAIGFHHNVPDDTLPIFWADKDWHPIFPRQHKLEAIRSDPRPFV